MLEIVSTQPALESLAVIRRELERDPDLESAHSRRGYARDLARFEEWRGGRPMTRLLVEQFAAELQQAGRAPTSINRALSAVRWWARRVGELAFEGNLAPAQREEVVTQAARVAAVENVKGRRLKKGRHIPAGEMRRLLAACAADATLAGKRDGAMIALAWATGARQAELTGARLSAVTLDQDNEEGLLQILNGKGNKERQVYFYHGAYLALAGWLAARGESEGYLFCPFRKGGRLSVERPLGHEAMRQILLERAAQARITEPLTWHDFRRTFIGNLLDSGVDLATAQQLAGHASPKTTADYDRRGQEVQRQAVQHLNLPYQS